MKTAQMREAGDRKMIDVRFIGNDDMEEVIEYYERYLNSGEMIRKAIRTAFEEERYFGCKAEYDGETAGFFTFLEGSFLTYPHPVLEQEIETWIGGEKVATVDALMVDSAYRKSGIAGQMAALCTKELKERGFKLFLVEIWVYPDGSSPAKRIYEQMGKVLWEKDVPLFYKDAHRYGLSCPICGDHCKCGAILELIGI